MATSVCGDITWECVKSVSGDVCVEVVKEAESARQEVLEKLEKQVLTKRRRHYWKRLGKIFFNKLHFWSDLQVVSCL